MIPNRQNKLEKITDTITKEIFKINSKYRTGPSWHFYSRILNLRSENSNLNDFIFSDTCLEMLYATLVAWDMDSRGAKMKDFDEFKYNIESNIKFFKAVEDAEKNFTWQNRSGVLEAFSNLYDVLMLMRTKGKLVSNSKALHFIFPSLCPPMDKVNTLNELYGNSGESKNKFLEVLEFTYDVLCEIKNPEHYLDDHWNTSETKLVDNGIILKNLKY